VFARVDAVGELLPGSFAALAGVLEGDFGERAQRQELFLAEVAVLESPPTRAGWLDQKEQTTPVEQLYRFVDGSYVLDFKCGYCHLGVTLWPLGNLVPVTPKVTPNYRRQSTEQGGT
jgi:hypothetical protein